MTHWKHLVVALVAAFEQDDDTSGLMAVYTNIDAPKMVPFAEFYGSGENPLQVTFGTASGNEDPTENSRIKSSEFATQGTKTHPVGTAIRGTYDDAPGTYRCTTGTCTSSDIEGNDAITLAGAGANWTFTADSGATVSEADDDYLSSGWWVQKADTGEPAWVHVFHIPSSTPFAAGDVTGVAGKATYEGGAAGKYAISDKILGDHGGHWTAKATLNADFETDANSGTIEGKIDGFTLANGESTNWVVTLNNSTLEASGTGITTASETNALTTWEIDDVPSNLRGRWYGTFSGETFEGQPGAVSGRFTAQFDTRATADDTPSGRMTGAFGATNTGAE